MNINRENYEAYFLDYYEKNLDTEQVAELMVFLEENPELKDEFNDFDINIILNADDNLQFIKKSILKKNVVTPYFGIDTTNYEQIMLKELDGKLSEKESTKLKGFLAANPKLKLEYNLLKSTFLVPDEKIVFENKEELKKGGVFALYSTQIYYAVSIAASIVILLGIYFANPKKDLERIDLTTLDKIETIHLTNLERVEIRARDFSKSPVHSISSEKIKIQNQENRLIANQSSNISTRREEELFRSIKSVNSFEISVPKDNNAVLVLSRNSFNGVSTSQIKPTKPEKEQTFIVRFIAGIGNNLIPRQDKGKKSLIEYTVDGYNMMADKEVEVVKEIDKNGNVIAYNVVGDNMQFTRIKRNSEKN